MTNFEKSEYCINLMTRNAALEEANYCMRALKLNGQEPKMVIDEKLMLVTVYITHCNINHIATQWSFGGQY
jgi:hypothetical protein